MSSHSAKAVWNGTSYSVNSPTVLLTTQMLNGKTRVINGEPMPQLNLSKLQSPITQFEKNSGATFRNVIENTNCNVINNKLKFSERLKVFIENGDNGIEKIEQDPYTFSEIDPQFSAPLNHALNSVESYIRKNVLPRSESPQTSITYPTQHVPVVVSQQDCTREEVVQTVHSRVQNKVPVSLSTYKNNVRQMKIVPPQVTSNSKLVVNKMFPKLVNNTANSKPQKSTKAVGWNKLSPKVEKKGETKSKSNKGKPLMNQIQKTASAMIRIVSKPRKPAPLRSMSLDSDMNLNGNKTLMKKSLLEESLLGLKSVKDNKLSSAADCTPRVANHIGVKSWMGNTTQNSSSTKLKLKNETKHESLQRIWAVRNKMKQLKRDFLHFGLTINDGVEEEQVPGSNSLLFQNYWFSLHNDLNSFSCHERRREVRLSQVKVELRRKLKQLHWTYKDELRDRMVELLLDSAKKQPNLTAFLISLDSCQQSAEKHVVGRSRQRSHVQTTCCFVDAANQQCASSAIPSGKHCQEHIAFCNQQQLFAMCSATRGDTSCRTPALDKTAETPLCLEHKMLSQKPKIVVNSKSVVKTPQPRKRSRSTPGSGRSRKRKRLSKDRKEDLNQTVPEPGNGHYGVNLHHSGSRAAIEQTTLHIISNSDIDESQEVEVGEEVLEMPSDLPLDSVELATQATRLLEEHDFTNVLNHIPADAFNDLFTEDKDEYEPTPQETEELERALAAVDNDVKSLEKLSETQGILDSLLDEQVIAQTLAQLPGVAANLEVAVPGFYQNGFHLEPALQDASKQLGHAVVLGQAGDIVSNHFVSDMLHS